MLLLTLGGAFWVAVVAVMTRNGFSGNERYLAMPVAIAAVVSGSRLGLARGRRRGPHKARCAAARARRARSSSSRDSRSSSAANTERLGRDNTVLRFEGKLRDDMQTAIDRAGGAEQLKRCGPAFAGAYNIAMASWMLDVPGKSIEYRPTLPGFMLRARSRPGVYPTPPVNGAWGRPVASAGEWTVYKACANPSGGIG